MWLSMGIGRMLCGVTLSFLAWHYYYSDTFRFPPDERAIMRLVALEQEGVRKEYTIL